MATKSFLKFGHVVSEICERTDTQTHTDSLTAILRTLSPAGGDIINQRMSFSTAPPR